MKFTKEKFLNVISESYSEIDEMGIMADKDPKNVKQKPLMDKDNRTQIGVLIRTDPLDMDSSWNAAYFLCGEPLESYLEKHKEAIENALKKYNLTTEDVIFNSDVCPLTTSVPETGVVRNEARPWERFLEKRLKKNGIVVTDYFGNVLSYEEIKNRQYSPPRGTQSFAVYVNGDLYANFIYDASTPKKQVDVQKSGADEFVERLKEQYPNLNIDVRQQKTQNAVQEKVSRIVMPILREEFNTDTPESEKGRQFLKILNERSIPALIVDDPRYVDRYTPIWSNTKLSYRILGFNFYESSDEFLQTVFSRSLGEDTEDIETKHLARIWAPERKWDPSRPTEKRGGDKSGDENYEPYYPRVGNYNVDVFGLRKGNWDIITMMVFELQGERIGDTFVWSASLENNFGRKRPTDYRVNKLEKITLSEDTIFDKKLIVTENVQLQPGIQFNNRYTIMNYEPIKEGLYNVIAKFKAKVEDIDPASLLDIATYDRSDINRIDESINKLIKQSIKEFYGLK
jgi:hypothetical protein